MTSWVSFDKKQQTRKRRERDIGGIEYKVEEAGIKQGNMHRDHLKSQPRKQRVT